MQEPPSEQRLRKRRRRGWAARSLAGVAAIIGHFFGAMPPPREQETQWIDLEHNRSQDRSDDR